MSEPNHYRQHSGDCSIFGAESEICDCGAFRNNIKLRDVNVAQDALTWAEHLAAIERSKQTRQKNISEPNQPEEREMLIGIPFDGSITARIETDPSKLPPLRWVKKDGSYRLEAHVTEGDGSGAWEEVPFWQGKEDGRADYDRRRKV